LPHGIRNIYNGIYRLTGVFPVGALSEGPGDRATHNKMQTHFGVPEFTPLEEFNTSAAVFYDSADDFMIQESTIGGQGDFLLMLALASAKNLSPATAPKTSPPSKPEPVKFTPSMSRGPASLFINRNESLFIITPSSTCKADSLAIINHQGNQIATLYRNEQNQYIWNTRHLPAGAYNIIPSDGSSPLLVRK
ncbi:MAG: hypothetical protein FWH22_07625, partial [Fibromonadales bacterium]|nr:hypothetical protein [Fibromonadales bacterium]